MSSPDIVITSAQETLVIEARDIVGAVKHYTTEVVLLAADPSDGELAYADDTDRHFLRQNGAWTVIATGGTITAGNGITVTPATDGVTVSVHADTDGSIVVAAGGTKVGILATDAQHGTRGGGTQHSAATTSAAGFQSATDKTRADALWARSLTAGAGLTGGGDLSADRSFAVGAGTGITVNADDVALDLGHANSWTARQTFAAGADLAGQKLFLDGAADTNGFLQYLPTSPGPRIILSAPFVGGVGEPRVRVGVNAEIAPNLAPHSVGYIDIGPFGDFSLVGAGDLGDGGSIVSLAPYDGNTGLWLLGGAGSHSAASADMIRVSNQNFDTSAQFSASTRRQNLLHGFTFVNQSGSAGYSMLVLETHENSIGSAANYIIDAGLSSLTGSANVMGGDSSAFRTRKLLVDTAGTHYLPSAATLTWSSTSAADGAADVGLKRSSAGVLAVTNGSSGAGSISATTFTGALSGNATTATTLATARAINGVSFDGSAAITVTAAAGTLTGATLASSVTASSLTSFGSSPTLVTPTISGAMTMSGASSIIGANLFGNGSGTVLLRNAAGTNVAGNGLIFSNQTAAGVAAYWDGDGTLSVGLGDGSAYGTLKASVLTATTSATIPTANVTTTLNVLGGSGGVSMVAVNPFTATDGWLQIVRQSGNGQSHNAPGVLFGPNTSAGAALGLHGSGQLAAVLGDNSAFADFYAHNLVLDAAISGVTSITSTGAISAGTTLASTTSASVGTSLVVGTTITLGASSALAWSGKANMTAVNAFGSTDGWIQVQRNGAAAGANNAPGMLFGAQDTTGVAIGRKSNGKLVVVKGDNSADGDLEAANFEAQSSVTIDGTTGGVKMQAVYAFSTNDGWLQLTRASGGAQFTSNAPGVLLGSQDTSGAALGLISAGTIGVLKGDNSAFAKFKAATVYHDSDGGGLAGTVAITGAENTGTARGIGIGTILFADATSRNNAGFVKIYIGTTAYYVPVFAAN